MALWWPFPFPIVSSYISWTYGSYLLTKHGENEDLRANIGTQPLDNDDNGDFGCLKMFSIPQCMAISRGHWWFSTIFFWSVSPIYFRQNTTTKTVKVLGLQPGTVDSPWIHLSFGSWWLGNRRPHEDGRGRIFQMATDDLATGEIHGFRWWNPCFFRCWWCWWCWYPTRYPQIPWKITILTGDFTGPQLRYHRYPPIYPPVYHHFSYKLCINWGRIHLLEEIINKNRVAEAKTWYDSMTLP